MAGLEFSFPMNGTRHPTSQLSLQDLPAARQGEPVGVWVSGWSSSFQQH